MLDADTPLPLISAAEITAARQCPAAALERQDKRAAHSLQIYQGALTLAHLISKEIENIENAQIDRTNHRRLTLAEPFARPRTASLLQDLIAAEILADVHQEQRSLGFTPGALPVGGMNPATLAALAPLQKLKGGIMTLMQDGIPRTTHEIADHSQSKLDTTRNAAKMLGGAGQAARQHHRKSKPAHVPPRVTVHTMNTRPRAPCVGLALIGGVVLWATAFIFILL